MPPPSEWPVLQTPIIHRRDKMRRSWQKKGRLGRNDHNGRAFHVMYLLRCFLDRYVQDDRSIPGGGLDVADELGVIIGARRGLGTQQDNTTHTYVCEHVLCAKHPSALRIVIHTRIRHRELHHIRLPSYLHLLPHHTCALDLGEQFEWEVSEVEHVAGPHRRHPTQQGHQLTHTDTHRDY